MIAAPVPLVVPLVHGLAAVLIPRGLSARQESELRMSLGLPARARRRSGR